ncbi:MAG: adenosylcobinamide-GDP ribazoletransferase, partial [Butyricicoccus sp.]
MLRDSLNGLLVAFGLYSALPLPQVEWKKHTMRYALGFLPLIGVLVGGCEYGWLLLARHWQLSAMLYGAVAVLLPVALTGGIHLDGFVDTCDALCSYGDREKRLAILKDPHVGAFG